MKRTLVTLGVAAIVLAGCADEAPSRGAGTHSETTPPTPSPLPSTPVPFGTPITVTGGSAGLQDLEAEVTVFGVNQNIAPDAITPPSGGHWAGADAQTCLKKSFKTFTVGWNDWSAADAKNGQYQATGGRFAEFPTPQYPFSKEPVAVGECVRGWVVFAVAFGVELTTVKFKPSFSPPVFWAAG
jgi:hypothetical protein